MPAPTVVRAAPKPVTPKTPPTQQAMIAHVLRRTTFGPFPGQVESLLPLGVDGVIEKVLAAPAM